jgi:hypothetical protein
VHTNHSGVYCSRMSKVMYGFFAWGHAGVPSPALLPERLLTNDEARALIAPEHIELLQQLYNNGRNLVMERGREFFYRWTMQHFHSGDGWLEMWAFAVEDGEARLTLGQNSWPSKALVPMWEARSDFVRCRPGLALQLKVAALADVASRGMLDSPAGFMGFPVQEPPICVSTDAELDCFYRVKIAHYRDVLGRTSAYELTREESAALYHDSD